MSTEIINSTSPRMALVRVDSLDVCKRWCAEGLVAHSKSEIGRIGRSIQELRDLPDDTPAWPPTDWFSLPFGSVVEPVPLGTCRDALIAKWQKQLDEYERLLEQEEMLI